MPTPPPLAATHTGMRVSIHGLFNKFTGRGYRPNKGDKFLLNEFLRHLEQVGKSYYKGKLTIVDEFLQLYSLDQGRPTSNHQSTMKAQIQLPEGIEFTDAQSKMNWGKIASGEMTEGLLILEGHKASGKTRLAKQIIGESTPMMLPNEKSLDHIFSVEKRKIAFFDEVRTTKPSGAEGRGTKVVNAPLNSEAITSAVMTGALVILAGEIVLLSPALERLAIRIRLGKNNPPKLL